MLCRWFFSKAIRIRLKNEKNYNLFLFSSIYLAYVAAIFLLVNKVWLQVKLRVDALLVYFLFLFFGILLGCLWFWLKRKYKQIAVVSKIIRISALCLLLVIVVLNSAIMIDAKINLPQGPNVLLIGVDTLRADHLGCYGYGRDTSPTIDALAEEAILFLRCFSHMPATTPSFTSILTSKLPVSHGVLANNYEGFMLENKHLTLAELLKNRGYKTAAFVSAWTLKKNANLSQGFDEYNDEVDGEMGG